MVKRKLGRGLDALIGRGDTSAPAPESPAEVPEPTTTAEPAATDSKPARRTEAPATATTTAQPAAPAPTPPAPAPGAATETPPRRATPPAETSAAPAEIPLDHIDVNPDQPRRHFATEELEALAGSIRREGVLQPVLVRRAGDRYQLVAGERRFRASRRAGRESIPARVVDLPDHRLLEVALIENLQRADLDPIELAQAYQSLLEQHGSTREELARRLGVSRPALSNTLRLLELPDDMQRAVARGQITPGHAKVLLSVTDDTSRRALFDRIAEESLSVRELEDAREEDPAPDAPDAGTKSRPSRPEKKPYLAALEEQLSETLGARVRIKERRSGEGGVVSIDFYSREDFDRLRALLGA